VLEIVGAYWVGAFFLLFSNFFVSISAPVLACGSVCNGGAEESVPIAWMLNPLPRGVLVALHVVTNLAVRISLQPTT
jgi:hypothetical protein